MPTNCKLFTVHVPLTIKFCFGSSGETGTYQKNHIIAIVIFFDIVRFVRVTERSENT